jgi:hypothetical protein
LTSERRDKLTKAGVSIGEDVKSIIAINPRLLDTESFDPFRVAKTITHEFGHSSSSLSGAKKTNAAIDKFDDLGEEFDSISDPAKKVKKFDEYLESYYEVMKQHGLEEGRAESFAIEAAQRKEGLRSVEEIKNLHELDGRLNSGYLYPTTFKGRNISIKVKGKEKTIYGPAYSDTYEKDINSRLGSIDTTTMKGPVSGLTGLSQAEFLEEVSMKGQHTGAAAFQGTMRNVSGNYGKAINEFIDEVVEPKTMQVTNDLLGSTSPVRADRMSKGLLDIRKSVSGEVFSSGRKISFAEAGSAVGARVSQTGGQRIAASIASNAPMAEEAIGATVREAGMASRSTSRALGHSAEAAAAVARGTKNSRGLRAIGAAKAAFKTRF